MTRPPTSRRMSMSDDPTPYRAAGDPRSVPCPHCHAEAALPAQPPWLIVDGVEWEPQVVSFRCPHCRGRIYLAEPTDEDRAADAERDALSDLLPGDA